MFGLLESLSATGVPDVSLSCELENYGDDLLASIDPADLHDVALVEKAAVDCGPEFIALAEAAARAGNPQMELLFDTAVATLPILTNLVFLDATEVALNSPHFLQAKSRRLAIGLYNRVAEEKTTSGLQAYAYLEALTRLGLTDNTARFRAMEYLTTIESSDPDDLLERLPKLIGLSLDCWNEPSLDDALYLLLEYEVSRTDAAYELAQQTLRRALEAPNIEHVLAGLKSARDQFTTVESMEEAREDAALYRSALDLTVAFIAGDNLAEYANDSMSVLKTAVMHRASMTMRSDLGRWAAPRRQAEIEWFILAKTLQSASDPLQEPSWNTPLDTLKLVLAAYRASRSITVMDSSGLRVVLEPVIEVAFLRSDGLLNHLRGLIDEGILPADELEVARQLLATVTAPRIGFSGDVVGKAWAAAPDLAAELGDDLDATIANELAAASESAPNFVRKLNNGAKSRAQSKARESDPVVDQLLERIMGELEDCPGLVGEARDEFAELLTNVLRFAIDRANIGRMNGGSIVHYLFKPEAGTTFTESYLQRDVASWLKATSLRRGVEMEQHDIAGGRADVTVTQVHKFTIEVKRELADASPAALLKAYGGQAAAYSVTGPAVSLEMVLDLTDQTRGTPSLHESVWVQEVPIPGGKPRHVVTLVVHGNRPTPRQVRAK